MPLKMINIARKTPESYIRQYMKPQALKSNTEKDTGTAQKIILNGMSPREYLEFIVKPRCGGKPHLFLKDTFQHSDALLRARSRGNQITALMEGTTDSPQFTQDLSFEVGSSNSKVFKFGSYRKK